MTTEKSQTEVEALFASLAPFARDPSFFRQLADLGKRFEQSVRQRVASDEFAFKLMTKTAGEDPRVSRLVDLARRGRIDIPKADAVPNEFNQLCHFDLAERGYNADFSQWFEITPLGRMLAVPYLLEADVQRVLKKA